MSDESVPTDLNVLMSLDPLDLTQQDLDQIIAYQRKQRANREVGVKTRKSKGDGPTLDIKSLLGQMAKPAPAASSTIRRR